MNESLRPDPSNPVRSSSPDRSIEQRKAEMLEVLQEEMRAHHERRRRMRTWVAGTTVAAALVIVSIIIAGFKVPSNFGELASVYGKRLTESIELKSFEDREQPKRTRVAMANYIATNRERVVERMVLNNQTVTPQGVVESTAKRKLGLELNEIDDQQLLDLLAESGQAAVLAEVDGQTVVVNLKD